MSGLLESTDVLTEEALAFVERLHRELRGERAALLAARAELDYILGRWRMLPGEDRATSLMIDEALEEHRPKVGACVTAARGRSATPDATLAVDITIDQTGKLIGVNAPKGTKGDPLLNTCIREAIAGARFPKSNTGLITIKRTFEKRWSTPAP